MENLFVYGTLLLPEIVFKITGRAFESKPAVLEGYKKYRVKGRDYPAVIEKPAEKVSGLLLQNVDKNSMQKFTSFEGYQYKKRNVEVIVNGEKISAAVFVWSGNNDKLEGAWDLNKFKETVLRNYS